MFVSLMRMESLGRHPEMVDFIGINLPDDLKKALGGDGGAFVDFLERMIHPKDIREDPRVKRLMETLKSYTKSEEKMNKLTEFFEWYIKNLPKDFVNESCIHNVLINIGKVWLDSIIEELSEKDKKDLPLKMATAMA